jgi:hypothetical protein
VTCVPPWQIDSSCTTASATDNNTANQDASCLSAGPTYEEVTMFIAYATSTSSDGSIRVDDQYLVRESGIVALVSRADSEHLVARLGPIVGLSGDQVAALAEP